MSETKSEVSRPSKGSPLRKADALSRFAQRCTVFISHLPKNTLARSIIEFFAGLAVKNVEVSGSMATYAFVEFETAEAADAALAKFHNKPFLGSGSRVAVQHSNSLTRLFLGGISCSTDAATIFAALHRVERVR
jgi:RNA recognition motif-containing protein